MKTVTFLYEYGHHETAVVTVGQREYRRFEPVMIPEKEYRSVVKTAYAYRFDSRETVMTDITPWAAEVSPDLYEGDITAIIPQYKTLPLTQRAVRSFRTIYPNVLLIVVDDGSQDNSVECIRKMADDHPMTSAVILPKNVGHGPALHAGIEHATTRRVFTMDSDVTVRRGGFLELMESRMIEAGLYGIGPIYLRDHKPGSSYLTCIATLYDREVYFTLPPFVHDADPMRQNMDEAGARGLQVECFPIFDYVTHDGAGTRVRLDRTRHRAWDFTGENQ